MTIRKHDQLHHGANLLPRVRVNSYNAELRDESGFVGDRANKRAFQARLEAWRNRLRQTAEDPLADVPTSELYRDKQGLQEVLLSGEVEAAGLLIGAIEEYAQELAKVVHRLLDHDGWRETQRIAAGGGFREGRVGELSIGRASVLLKSMGSSIDIIPIHNGPDDAGLIGTIHLVPPELLAGHNGVLAVDIGGTNFRAGIVALDRVEPDRRASQVRAREAWRHADERPSREDAVRKLADMLGSLLEKARGDGIGLAPHVGIACPGRIAADGSIERGAQNLPGNWEAPGFNLAIILHDLLAREFNWDAGVLMHNDAVVQGLSELPFMGDVEHWGVLTIGTGLGNAHFSNR